jgi:hypothetical protein
LITKSFFRASAGLLLSLFCGHLVYSQANSGHSPISRFGLGQLRGPGLTRAESIGGAGIALPASDFSNLLNPALLLFNDKVNLNMDLWYQAQNLKVAGNPDYTSAGAGPALVSISIPVSSRFVFGAGIKPHSVREFYYQSRSSLGTDTLQIRQRGSGGTTQTFLSFGWKAAKGLSFGLETSYLFGTLEDSLTFGILPLQRNLTFVGIDKRKVSQFLFKPGAFYQFAIPGKEETYLGIGATAQIGGNVRYKKYSTFEVSGVGEIDTLAFEQKGNLEIESRYRIGLSYFKTMNWGLSLEGELIQPGSSGLLAGSQFVSTSSMAVRFGAEYSPGVSKSTRYVNIMTFRAGFAHEEMPYALNGKKPTDTRLTFGTSFPVIRKEAKYSRPLINVGFALGQRGLNGSYLGMERYWQLSLGFTLNDFLWFNRYKID